MTARLEHARRLASGTLLVGGLISALLLPTGLRPTPVHAQDEGWSLSPRGGPSGTEVSVTLDDLPPATPVLLGFGGVASPHEILASTVTDSDGVMTATVRIPSWIEPGRAYLFYMAYSDQRPVLFSPPFLATDSDGVARVAGTITDEGVTCVAMRGPHDELYTLAGNASGLEAGDRVVVVATVAEMSMCSQGLTLAVREIVDPPGG